MEACGKTVAVAATGRGTMPNQRATHGHDLAVYLLRNERIVNALDIRFLLTPSWHCIPRELKLAVCRFSWSSHASLIMCDVDSAWFPMLFSRSAGGGA
jgi:hypothetical protein